MIFYQFCEREAINPHSFMAYIVKTTHNPAGLIQHEDLLSAIWKEYLAFQYMQMIAKEEMK